MKATLAKINENIRVKFPELDIRLARSFNGRSPAGLMDFAKGEFFFKGLDGWNQIEGISYHNFETMDLDGWNKLVEACIRDTYK
jgi:hypothetical protein